MWIPGEVGIHWVKGRRADLNCLFRETIGELSVGHLLVNGGERLEVKPVRVGLLGADYNREQTVPPRARL